LFFEQVFSDCGFAALLAERLCLSVRAFKESAATPPRQSLKQLTAQRKARGFPQGARQSREPTRSLVAAVLRCVSVLETDSLDPTF
jgi:hypothetical protein